MAPRRKGSPSSKRAEARRLEKLLTYENALYGAGHGLIAGVDEAGVGPLAGPVVAAAVILPRGYTLTGLDDSKKVASEERRLGLAAALRADAVAFCVAEASVEEIDRLNIYQAGLLAMRRAVEGLSRVPDAVLVDARTIPALSMPQQGIIGGDGKSLSIAAASILAKTTRDLRMRDEDARHPGYGLSEHKGYGTPSHLEALMRLGPSPLHRRSFAPVRRALGEVALQLDAFAQRPS